MGRQGLNKYQQELYSSWDYFRKCCVRVGCEKYEGVPYDKEWETFEGFVKANWFRYFRAKIKWKNYKRVAPRVVKGIEYDDPLINRNIRLKRKVKELGFTKDNTVFTSPSDCMKYVKTTHKYMFEGQLCGTRDIKNILRKRGINLNMESITQRLRAGQDLFSPSIDCKIKWKGKYRSYVEIADMEKISYEMLKRRNVENDNIKKSVDQCREYEGMPTFDFEGQSLRIFQIAEILSSRVNVDKGLIARRISRYGLNMEILSMPKLERAKVYKGYFQDKEKKHKKVVYAIKDGVEQKFESIAQAAEVLKLGSANISLAVNGRTVHCGGYKFRFEGAQYNTNKIQTMEEQMADARKIMQEKSRERHEAPTRHCVLCDSDKDKELFYEGDFTKCIECTLKEKGIKNIGQHKERKEKLEQGLIWCSDCKSFQIKDNFHKSSYYHTGYGTICKECSKLRARLKKYGTLQNHNVQGM